MKITTRVQIVCRRTKRSLLWIKSKTRKPACPGGTQEDGELLEHTISRELGEEAGIHFDSALFTHRGWVRIYKRYSTGTFIKNQTHVFILEVDSDTFLIPTSEEITEMVHGRWVPFDQIPFDQMQPYYQAWFNDVRTGPVYRDVILTEDSQLESFVDVHPNSLPWAEPKPSQLAA